MASQSESQGSNALTALAQSTSTQPIIKAFAASLCSKSQENSLSSSQNDLFDTSLNALNAFLQANVTGPVLPSGPVVSLESEFKKAWNEASGPSSGLAGLRRACLGDLEVDGVAPYAYIPHIELFGLARYALGCLSKIKDAKDVIEVASDDGSKTRHSAAWTKLRIDGWHYKLLTQPSLASGSNFTRSSQWSEVPTLAARILDGIDAVSKKVLSEEVWAAEDDTWSRDDKVSFLVETANYHILLGRNDLAKDALDKATRTSNLQYALSGALGKRTKFQQSNISQLVVLAKSADDKQAAAANEEEEGAKPDALKLNDDTLLEDISFAKDEDKESKKDTLPPALAQLTPDDQPQLSPLDQMILLTEATMKDAFAPTDTLTSEEILPFAVRVLADKSTNWQIYTQALLVRSRIEVHRSRTLERGVLQLQAVADQVIADTTDSSSTAAAEPSEEDSDVPAIQVTQPDQSTQSVDKPTSFLPAPKPSESAPAHIRLQYIHALSSPPRWHLESELAYAWAGIGSLASALEIFKRLRLWAEVALCLASRAAIEDPDGRGSGGEEKARGIIRWRLFHRTGQDATSSPSDPDKEDIGDVTTLKGADFTGPERDPPLPNAARLWCILGDIESEPAHYERAWEISNHRYSRAQRSLGECYVQKQEWEKARDAYKKATQTNRLSPDMWGRLGDISLRLANFEEAAEAYSRSISSATDEGGGEGAKTWSNLGTALWSLYLEVVEEEKKKGTITQEVEEPKDVDDEDEESSDESSIGLEKTVPTDPSKLLAQSLTAFKKGASIAHSNWRIWDNVLTLSSRMRPPSIPDMVLSLTHMIRIRQTEEALDIDILSALLSDVVLSKEKDTSTGIYEPPRGSMERLVSRLLEEEVTPLITHRSDLWSLISRLRSWSRDYAGAIDAAERSWRAAMSSPSSAASSGGLAPSSAGAGMGSGDWTSEKAGWENVVQRTDELASMLENWGPGVEAIGPKWKGRVRSAVRSVMGKGKENWEGSEGWKTLEGIMEGLKS